MDNKAHQEKSKQGGPDSPKNKVSLDAKISSKEFWSILINSVKMGADSTGHAVVTVEAQFVHITHVIQGTSEEYVPWYLTSPVDPITISIPPWFFNKPIDKVSARDVLGQFVRIFRKPIDIVPTKRIDIPIHKIPPVKRKAFVKAYAKMTDNQFITPPPEAGRAKK